MPSPWSKSCSVMSDSLWPHGLYSPWNSPGQNTGVSSLSLLQGIFPTQGLNEPLKMFNKYSRLICNMHNMTYSLILIFRIHIMFIDLYLTVFLFEYSLKQASLMVQLVKNPQCRRPGFNPWVGKIPWRREQLPTPVFWPGEFHRLYSPWGHKESDTTEWLSLSLFTVKSKAIIKSTMFGVLKYWFIYLTVWGLSCSPWA